MKVKKENEKLIEVRFRIHKDKDEVLFTVMKRYPEVNWSEVAKRGIVVYLKKRKKNKGNELSKM